MIASPLLVAPLLDRSFVQDEFRARSSQLALLLAVFAGPGVLARLGADDLAAGEEAAFVAHMTICQ